MISIDSTAISQCHGHWGMLEIGGIMANPGVVASAVGVFLAASALFASADAGAVPFARFSQSLEAHASVTPASFWGEPFPYGYRYQRRQCIRHLLIETPNGPRWTKIFVCHP
jgi:hypothetical protein